ncbi:hypothetical protein V2G26_013385 [Clonostachys chloroleuca]
MRSNIFALPLLALGGGVLASRCVPRPSSALSVSTTPTLSTPSTESSTVLTPTTSTATPSIPSTESSSESTTPSVSLSTPSTESTPSTVPTPSTLSTSSTEPTPSTTSTPSTISTSSNEPTPSTTLTPSAEPTPSTESTTLFTSTFTTSSTAQATSTAAPQQPNLLTNSGFEDSTIAPWKLFRPSINRGQISIATDPVYEGSQSGNFQYSAGANSGGGVWGIYQSVSGSGFVANDPYQITLRIRVAPGTCPNVFVAGTGGSDGRLPASQVTVDVAAASVGWVEVTTTVQYNQGTINLGPGLAIISTCSGPVSFWVDNVALRKAS